MKRVHQLWQYSSEMAFIDSSVVAFCTPLMKRVHQLWQYSSEMAFIDSPVVAFCTPLMKRVHQHRRYSSEMAFIDSSVVAFCTPLMKRVHQHRRYSSEMAFIDSSGGMDRSNYLVFLLLTHSPVGGLPLGLFVTTSVSEAAVKCGLNLLKDVLHEGALFGHGEEGPKVVMTDDCTAERSAIHEVWPLCTLLLCIFHVLQAAWRWLWENRHSIPKNHRPHLLKKVMVADLEEL